MSLRRNLLRLAEILFPAAPSLSLALVDSAASRRHQQGTGRNTLGPELIQEILGPLSSSELDRIALRSAASRYRGKMLRRAVERRGLTAASGLLGWTPGSRERLLELKQSGEGVFLTTWHIGPTLGIWSGLAPLDISLLKFQVGDRFELPRDWKIVDPDEQGDFRAPAMKLALKHLRKGGWVVIPADMYQWSPRATFAPCLGRRAAFSNALAVLAELSGARVVPVFAHWDAAGRKIEVDIQSPLSLEGGGGKEGEFERLIVGEFAQRVERYLREHLDEYDVYYASMFAKHERIDGSDSSIG